MEGYGVLGIVFREVVGNDEFEEEGMDTKQTSPECFQMSSILICTWDGNLQSQNRICGCRVLTPNSFHILSLLVAFERDGTYLEMRHCTVYLGKGMKFVGKTASVSEEDDKMKGIW
jgi:hypothetical protein